MDAAHWRGLQSLAAVVRTQGASRGRRQELAKTLQWLAVADDRMEAVGQLPLHDHCAPESRSGPGLGVGELRALSLRVVG